MHYDPFLTANIEAALPKLAQGLIVTLTIGGTTRIYHPTDAPALRQLLLDQYHAFGVRGVLPYE